MPLDEEMVMRALLAPHERAQFLRAQGVWREADLIDETLLQVFLPLLTAMPGESAWLRAARRLCDESAPLPVDALASAESNRAALRLAAITGLPRIDTLDGLEVMHMAIRDAIAYGAPTYNSGDPRGCAVRYWATALALVGAPIGRGFTGQARATKLLRQVVEEPLPSIGNNLSAIDEYAWRLRHALDAALEVTG